MNYFKGIGYSLKGLTLISQPGIRRFVVIPLSINIFLFSIGIYLLTSMFSQWIDSLMPGLPDWLSFIEDFLYWILWPLFSIMIFFIVFYTFTFAANLISAPFNSLLAQKVEATLTANTENNIPYMPPWETIKKSITSEIVKLIYLLKWSIIILIISFIPVINVISPFLWIAFGAWMLAIEYIDYPMGNHNHFFKEIDQLIRSRKTCHWASVQAHLF